jgi:HlyD family secretion protein/epimerase transport system membrane fusion protein
VDPLPLPHAARPTVIEALPPPPILGRKVRGPIFAGVALATIFFGSFGTWSALAVLAGGATAHGVISPDGSRKSVQHLEGGIIGQILVRDGDIVELGQPVVVLEDVQARASYEMLRAKRDKYRAMLARLAAEEVDAEAIDFPADLTEARAANRDAATILESQERLFAARRELYRSKEVLLEERVAQLHAEIRGLEAQVDSASLQLDIIAEELEGKRELWNKKLLPKPQLLALERAQAEIAGERGENEAGIARAERQIGEAELELLAMHAERREQIAKERDEAEAILAETEEKLLASADVLTRTVVTAPQSGVVVDLAFKTTGGVVLPGDRLLDIVPRDDDLLIDAQLNPTDIDVVYPGLPAQIHLTAYSSRRTPRVDGTVRSVSADRLVDEQTGEAYYLVRVEVDRARLEEEVGPEVKLVAGMPADVLIVTSHRTPLEYLLQPLLDSFRWALREV